MNQTLSRLLRAAVPALLLFTLPAWASTPANPEGHAIGSAGFNELVSKQIQPGTFSTEQQPDGGFILSNTMQTVSAHITPTGVLFDSIGNSAGKGGFSLQLSQWGRAGALQPAASSAIYSENDVVFHSHAGGIAEKFSNSSDGIRQDFIIPVKPQGSGELQVQLQVNGAHVEQKNNGAVIVLQSGRKLTYNNLKVMDSKEQIIPAQMVVANNRITIKVDDSSAQYPLTIDPTVGDENWVSMGNGINDGVFAFAESASGDLYVGGNFTSIDGLSVNYIARWDGENWHPLGSGLNASPTEIAIDSSENVYVAGTFNVAGGVVTNHIAKWDGISWSALGEGLNETVRGLAVDSVGDVYAGGFFTMAGGNNISYVAKWNGSGWSALGSGVDNYVEELAVDGNGNLYVGGAFQYAGGIPSTGIAKWDGVAWQWISSVNHVVRAIALDGVGNLYIGGAFTGRVAKWTGYSWSILGSGLGYNTAVEALALDANGNLFAAGYFTAAGGVDANRVAKWNGFAWSALGSGLNGTAYALAVDASSNLYVGGNFSIAGANSSSYFAKWVGDTDTDHDGVPDVSDPFPVDTDNDGLNNDTDSDDDNDGIPDGVDADPLNAAVGMNLNGVYKGSSIKDGANVQ